MVRPGAGDCRLEELRRFSGGRCGCEFGMVALAGYWCRVAALFDAAGFVGVDAVVADGVVVAVGDVLDSGG